MVLAWQKRGVRQGGQQACLATTPTLYQGRPAVRAGSPLSVAMSVAHLVLAVRCIPVFQPCICSGVHAACVQRNACYGFVQAGATLCTLTKPRIRHARPLCKTTATRRVWVTWVAGWPR